MRTKHRELLDKFCPKCGSSEIHYDEDFGFYKCSCCEHCWAHDEDDPDYAELDEDLEDDDLN
ncbi:hypothetical protein [Microcoleus sp. herbarium12]|uniref:hypothetical protein n=1 Tax=Microcoleus sp. herbarium12 TaxID=3055437 RepID=UPI002FCF482B